MSVFEWWNLIFLLPGAGAFILLVFQMMGISGDHDTDADVDTDVDADVGLAHDVDIAHAHELHELGAGHAETSILTQALGFLGVGKVPIGVILMTLAFVWAFIGWTSNELLSEFIPSPFGFVWMSVVAAGSAAVLATRFLARVFSRFMPGTASYATSERELVGRRGRARYAITENSGAVSVRDRYGNTLEILCRTQKGEIPAGTPVVLMQYDEARRIYEVARDPLRGIEGPGDIGQS